MCGISTKQFTLPYASVFANLH